MSDKPLMFSWVQVEPQSLEVLNNVHFVLNFVRQTNKHAFQICTNDTKINRYVIGRRWKKLLKRFSLTAVLQWSIWTVTPPASDQSVFLQTNVFFFPSNSVEVHSDHCRTNPCMYLPRFCQFVSGLAQETYQTNCFLCLWCTCTYAWNSNCTRRCIILTPTENLCLWHQFFIHWNLLLNSKKWKKTFQQSLDFS